MSLGRSPYYIYQTADTEGRPVTQVISPVNNPTEHVWEGAIPDAVLAQIIVSLASRGDLQDWIDAGLRLRPNLGPIKIRTIRNGAKK